MKHILIITIEIYRFGAKWSSDTFRKYYVFFQEKFAPPNLTSAPTNVWARDILGIEDYRKKSCIPIQYRATVVRSMGVFMISRKMLNNGFAIDQEFECLPVDGKVFILGHEACSAKNQGTNFLANRAPACTRKRNNQRAK